MIVHRRAVRAILLSPEREILLMRIRLPGRATAFWIAPGGGLEEGESIEDGLRRELREELDLTDFAIGPLVWLRQHTFDWRGQRLCQHEQYRIVEANRFEPVMSDAVEAEVLDRFRWWPVVELAETSEELVPLSLPAIVERYLSEGAPAGPLQTEVRVD